MVFRNDELMMQMSSEFQRTNDASFATESLASTYIALPGLKGFWPMSAMGGAGFTARDFSTNDLHLTNSGVQHGFLTTATPTVPVTNFGSGGTDRLYRTDSADFNITGTEGEIISAVRGLTMGVWVRPTNALDHAQSVMGQWDDGGATNQRCYMIHVGSDDKPLSYISTNGTAVVYIAHTSTIPENEWSFLCLQWSPSAVSNYLRIWINNTYVENSNPAVSVLYNSSANFTIGCSLTNGATGYYYNGQLSMAFLCGVNIGDTNIRRLYYRSRPAFQSRNLW